MNVTDYFNSLPMDTKYYLLDHSAEPDKIKEVVGDKAEDSVFFTELMKFIQAAQEKRIADAKQQVVQQQQMLNTDFKPAMNLIKILATPFEKRCKVCGAPITVGEYCEGCKNKQEKGKGFYSDFIIDDEE